MYDHHQKALSLCLTSSICCPGYTAGDTTGFDFQLDLMSHIVESVLRQ